MTDYKTQAQRIVGQFISGYAVNNTPALTDAIAQALEQAYEAGREEALPGLEEFKEMGFQSMGGDVPRINFGSLWMAIKERAT